MVQYVLMHKNETMNIIIVLRFCPQNQIILNRAQSVLTRFTNVSIYDCIKIDMVHKQL
jgi:hypothetical protein